MTRILDDLEIRRIMNRRSTVERMEKGYEADARGEVVPFPRNRTDARGVTLTWMGAAIPSLDLLGFRSYLYDAAGSDRGHQIVGLYRYSTMELKALFLGRQVGIQRTGAALAAALRIAQPGVRKLGIIGTGTQAQEILACACIALHLDSVWAWSREAGNRARFQAWAKDVLHQEIELGRDARQVVAETQAIALATSAEAPVITPDLLPGPRLLLSISAYRRPEIDVRIIDAAPYVWTDSVDQAQSRGSLFDQSPRREKLRPLAKEAELQSLRDEGSTRIIINTGAAWEEILLAESLLQAAERSNAGIPFDFAAEEATAPSSTAPGRATPRNTG